MDKGGSQDSFLVLLCMDFQQEEREKREGLKRYELKSIARSDREGEGRGEEGRGGRGCLQ